MRINQSVRKGNILFLIDDKQSLYENEARHDSHNENRTTELIPTESTNKFST